MIVYHGSTISIPNPDLSLGRSNLDFGKGFYVTTLRAQAERWAIRKAYTQRMLRSDSANAIVSEYDFITEGLNILSFDGYTEEWLDFVISNRSRISTPSSLSDCRDAIYGSVANDDVAREIDDYMELMRKDRVNETVTKALLYQLRYSKVNDQYCIASESALANLKYIKSYKVE